ncbi:hypothetical protein FB451DRAFT_1369198 [Mycena latifolia]|nr:hypothetical protein FB451DRAFT_1369198 [Mycena latifolia]
MSTLTLQKLRAPDSMGTGQMDTSARAVMRRKLSAFDGSHVKALFVTPFIGLAFPLYSSFITYYLSTRADFGDGSTYVTYRNHRKVLTGIFILASITARSSNSLLGFNCAYSFTSNIMSPELFPTKDRGTGNALVASANRIFGVMAPVVALYANIRTSVPIYIAGILFIVSGFIVLLLPFESRGRAAL